jgi:hypothetical protein
VGIHNTSLISALWGPIPVSRRERAQDLFKRANLLTLAAMMTGESNKGYSQRLQNQIPVQVRGRAGLRGQHFGAENQDSELTGATNDCRPRQGGDHEPRREAPMFAPIRRFQAYVIRKCQAELRVQFRAQRARRLTFDLSLRTPPSAAGEYTMKRLLLDA